jgi:phage protein D/phage baseplate assembly protein gpV
MQETPHVRSVAIRIDGSPAPPDAANDLIEVTVDLSLSLPGMFALRLVNPGLRWLNSPAFREGREIEVNLVVGKPVLLIAGRIAGLEPDLDPSGAYLIVRGYDMSHRLHRGSHRRSFTRVTDGDLLHALARDSGLLGGTCDGSPEIHEYVFQNNQSNAEFLRARARLSGCELRVEGNVVHLRRPTPDPPPIRLAWGKSLTEFRGRLSTAGQVDEVEVRGWNARAKQAIVGRARRPQVTPDLAAGLSGEADPGARPPTLTVVDQVVESPAQADRLAQSVLDDAASMFVEAEGVCDLDAALAPGRQVRLEGVGRRFEGTYTLTRVVHEWGARRPAVTRFSVSGRRDPGLWGLLEAARGRPSGLQLAVGVVTDNRDPEDLGRVKVRFPWLSDSDESAWARVASPMAGPRRGLFFLPEVDDEVLVGFEHGDIHRPLVLGGLWNGHDRPPIDIDHAAGKDGTTDLRVIRTRAGHQVIFDDTPGRESIRVVDSTRGNSVVLDSAAGTVRIEAAGDVTVKASRSILLEAPSGLKINGKEFPNT